MKKFVGKLRCCSSVVILMLFVILGAIKEKNFSGYEAVWGCILFLWVGVGSTIPNMCNLCPRL